MTSAPWSFRRVATTGRAPLTSLGIPFGLSGLAGTWTMAARTGLATNAIAEVLWSVAALAWIVVVTNYLWRSGNRGGSVRADLRDPVQGAFASLAPTTAMLICTHYATYLPRSGRIATGLFMVIALLFGAWFLAQLALHERSVDTVHAGYLLPTFAIFSAPPAVAGNAWFAHNSGQVDLMEILLLGTFVVLIGVQVMMLGAYVRLRFHLGFWAFTFTAASSGTYAVHWLALWHGAGHEALAWLTVAIVTAVIGGIAVRSVGALLRAHRASRAGTGPIVQARLKVSSQV
ncbi:hypothetical protein [Pengzhenrongella sp.]|jgi:tellurite resistance protein|uniref:SLAC1 family transporter n=1 Tax=Pengzhenrongella sp. TaxID=2888820 RepID=UPI002F94406A